MIKLPTAAAVLAFAWSLNVLAADAPARVERGNLVSEGIPEIPAALAERTNRYQQTRSAGFQGWLADGSALITTRFAETAQVHRVAVPGADRRQLTFFAEPIAEVAPSPEGRGFVFAKDHGGDEFYQLYWFDLASGRYRLLSDGKSRNTEVRFAHRGDVFAFSTTKRNGRDTDVHMTQTGANGSTPLVEAEGAWSAVDWSPDGSRLLVQKGISASESELYIVDIAKSARTRFHPAQAPIAFGNARFAPDGRGIYYVSDEGSEFQQLRYERLDGSGARVLSANIPWDIEALELSDDGRWLAFTANADGLSELHLLDLKTGRPAATPKLPAGLVGALHFAPGGRRLGFVLNGARSPTDVFSVVPGQTRLTRWTQSETGGLDAATFTEPTLVHYPSFDGRSIPAFYYAPSTPGPHPVLIDIHGGPEGQALPVFNATTEFYVRELGLAVLLPNVRGSTGYGKTWLGLDNGFKREDSVQDIGALLDWIATRPELDPARVAVTGGSYGGYMVLASMTHYNDRLAGGIDVVGISNFLSFLANTQDYRRDLRRVEYGDERVPEMKTFLERISPQASAAKITKPMLIVAGANDPRVPYTEGEQMAATIRGNGGEVWYLLGKDEGHGFRKKGNRDYYGNAAVLFLQKILGADGAAPKP
ncbi:MAG: S9 family peptidase [Nevskia sp.]